jgi:hypothetical protein
MAPRTGERFRMPRRPAETSHLTCGFVPDRPLPEGTLEHPTRASGPSHAHRARSSRQPQPTMISPAQPTNRNREAS